MKRFEALRAPGSAVASLRGLRLARRALCRARAPTPEAFATYGASGLAEEPGAEPRWWLRFGDPALAERPDCPILEDLAGS